MKGIGMWIMSKVVMLIFLFLTFSIVVGFLNIGKEKITNDAALSLTEEIKGSLENILSTSSEKASVYVPIPETMPSRTYGLESKSGQDFRAFSLVFGRGSLDSSNRFWIAFAWDKYPQPGQRQPKSYVASSSLFIDDSLLLNQRGVSASGSISYDSLDDSYRIVLNSEDNRFVYMFYDRLMNELCITGCTSSDISTHPIGCDMPCPKP